MTDRRQPERRPSRQVRPPASGQTGGRRRHPAHRARVAFAGVSASAAVVMVGAMAIAQVPAKTVSATAIDGTGRAVAPTLPPLGSAARSQAGSPSATVKSGTSKTVPPTTAVTRRAAPPTTVTRGS